MFYSFDAMCKYMKIYKISEFAKLIGVSKDTLRNWDKSGLLKAYRTPSRFRFYTHKQYEDYMKMPK